MHILRITSSPRTTTSQSRKLGEAIIEKLQAANPGATVQHHDLTNPLFPQMEEAFLGALFAPVDQHTELHKSAIRHSNEALEEVKAADVLVIEAPLYNFAITSSLKSWIDHIARPGLSFKYTDKGPVGLIEGKKVYVAVSSGGVYSEEPAKTMDFVTPYLTTILGFMGMTDVEFIRAEGFNVP
ncbi:MAG: FMN-dependent NADH-azoreductase, partial [Sphingobacteriaceae bacterium]